MFNGLRVTVAVACAMAIAVNYGCAGTHANPVPLSQVGDDKMGCNQIETEMKMMLETADREKAEGQEQVVKNVVAVTTGIFLIVPLFFVDPHNNNSVEEKAARDRYVKLQAMGKDRGCF